MRNDAESLRSLAEAARGLYSAAREVKECAFGLGDLLHRAADLAGPGEAARAALRDAAAMHEEVVQAVARLSRSSAEFGRASERAGLDADP